MPNLLNTIVLDFETTGLKILSDRPVQAAFAVYNKKGELVDAQSHILDPLMNIDPGAYKVHKIGFMEIKSKGKPLGWFARQWCRTVWDFQPVRLIGYNLINFDLPILQRILQQYGSGKFRQPPQEEIVDVMFLAQRHFRTRRWPKLKDSLNRLGLSFNEEALHDALEDAKQTWEVYKTLTRKE